jgi:Tol biopolymer transport system component
MEIWTADSSGLNAVQLTTIAAYCGSPAWSPDGRQIAFDCSDVGHFEIYLVKADGGRPVRLTNTETDNSIPRWSRDGRWIYFRSVRSGDSEIWRMPSAGGDPVQVTKHGGFVVQDSPDGADLYYTKADRVSGLWRAPAAGGQETLIVDAVKARSFAVVKNGIYFFAPGPLGTTLLQFHDFATRRIRPLGRIETPVVLYLDASGDGRVLLYSLRDQEMQDLMLVDNFR